MLTRLMRILALILISGTGRPAFGQGVGGNSPTDTSHILQPRISVPEDPVDWLAVIATPSSPISVELDPNGLAWTKTFRTEGDLPITPTNVLLIREHIAVAGNSSWTGWHTSIATEGFSWTRYGWSPLFDARVEGTRIPVAIEVFDSTLDATFLELLPGTIAEFEIRFARTELSSFTGPVELLQYPIPEPASALLLMFSFALPSLRRR